MSPEQGSRIPVSETSDWYSVGVMLYEALTDRQPFNGSFVEMLWEKNHAEPVTPKTLLPDIPDDLNGLCLDLLRRQPSARPSAEDIMVRLGEAPAAAMRWQDAPLSLRPGPFVGRQAHMAALHDAFDDSRQGHTVSVYVHGTSGIGKSALVRHFLDEVRDENAVILSGRCYERESTPYKALDSLVDSLSQYLKRLPVEQAEALMPTDVLALARVFPVLRRVEAVAGTRRQANEVADSFELRRRAFAALRELFVRLARQRDVVLFIDDLQWGDADSAALLDELLRPPDSPTLLLIATYRTEETATSPLLQRLLATSDSRRRELPVGELEPSEARELARALLGGNPTVAPSQADAIARESAGNPFFIDELVRFGQLSSAGTLDELVRTRVLQLPEAARRLLEVVAVAGQPLDVNVAEGAAAVGDEPSAVAVLRVGHLVRLRTQRERREIETYHDRIREAVVAGIPAETLKSHHRRLAVALVSSGRADPEQLALHFQEAGDSDRAAQHAIAAADRATEALAFDRAARFYRMALELGVQIGAEARRRLHIRLGDALANAGRGADAAKSFLAAVDGEKRAEALVLEGRAAGQLLRAGYIDQALPIFERMTGRIGLLLVQPSWRTLLSYLLGRAAIRLRGLGFRERDASLVPPEELIRLDTHWLLASGMVLINSVRARELNNRYMLLALRAGEPARVAVAIAAELGIAGIAGWRLRKRLDRVLAIALALAERLRNPNTIGMVHTYASAGTLLQGRWRACWEHGRIAEQVYREHCTGVAWELDFTHIVSLRGLYYLGGLRELSRRLPALIREAQERDDLMAVATLRTRHSYLPLLAADEPQRALEDLRRMVGQWSHKTFSNQHYWAMVAEGEIALYERDGEAAWNLLADQWGRFKKSGLIRLQLYRIEALHLRARGAIVRASKEGLHVPDQQQFLRSAERDVRRIEREGTPWGLPLARLIRAGIAAARTDPEEGLRQLARAEDEFAQLDMALYAAAARRRRGELLGGEGQSLVASADARMAEEDIRNPGRMADMLAPGLWSGRSSLGGRGEHA